MAIKPLFKQCPMCKKEWGDRDAFLDDGTLELNGYGADFEALEKGLFYFTHKIPGCFSTMTILAETFFDLYSGEKYTQSKKGGDECPKFCLKKETLDRCSALCENAFVREIIQVILQRQNGREKETVSYKVEEGTYTMVQK